jgi:deoxyribodipyrimidine photo-lyase
MSIKLDPYRADSTENMTHSILNILWFRRDLRLHDNEIVARSCAENQAVLPCFILDPWFYQNPEVGQARVQFLFESLEDLDRNLRARGSQLYLLEGNSIAVLQSVATQMLQEGYRPKLYFSRDVQVEYGIARDREILNYYQQQNLDYFLGLSNFLQIEQDRGNQWRDNYYTYLRSLRHEAPGSIYTPNLPLRRLSFEDLRQKYQKFWRGPNQYFSGGEASAVEKLDTFLKGRYQGYHWRLSRPWQSQQGGTSHLSPHILFGTLSTRTIYQTIKQRAEALLDQPKAQLSLRAFRDRLRWRDRFTQRLYHHPEIAHANRYPEFDEWYTPAPLIPEKQALFLAWQHGNTGFPLVDASMRQLRTMGWMNFRMRAMCATFLTINCGISWHHGAKHYMNCLVDGDLAIDNWQWQMQAGATNPLSETFRIYNPNKNIEDRDPDLKFLRFWVPELRGYSLADLQQKIHQGKAAYPDPILDWSLTRKVNGKVVSDLRKKVRSRLQAEGGADYEQALQDKTAVEMYWKRKDSTLAKVEA